MSDALVWSCRERLDDRTWVFMPFHRDDLAALLDQIERLEAWKASAMTVLAEWEGAYEALAATGYSAPLGSSKARFVAAYLAGEVEL